jgi:hypothetical protein
VSFVAPIVTITLFENQLSLDFVLLLFEDQGGCAMFALEVESAIFFCF